MAKDVERTATPAGTDRQRQWESETEEEETKRLIPTGIPSCKGLSMLLMLWGPPRERQRQCRSTGSAQCVCVGNVRQLVPLPSSTIPFSVGLAPRFEWARAPAAQNPPMAEGRNHRVSTSNRAQPGCWGWVVTAIEHHLQTITAQLTQCETPRNRLQISSRVLPTTVDRKRLRVTLNRDQHRGVGRSTSKSLCRVPAQTPPCVLGLLSSTRNWPLLRRSTTTRPKQIAGPAQLESSPKR